MPPATAAIQPQQRAKRRRYSPDLLMYVTAAFLWTSVWRFQDLWPIIGKLQLPIILELALAVTLMTSLHGPRNLKWTRCRIFAIPLIMLAIMVAGIPISLWPGKTLTFVTKDFAPSILLMAAVAISLRESDDLNWLAFAHLVGATIYSVYIYIFIPVASGGRLGNLVYYDANDFALLVVCAIPFAIYFLRPGVAIWKRVFALLALALFVQMVIKSGSRGGFIALIVLTVYIVVAFRAIPTKLRLSTVAIGLAMMVTLGSSSYWDMMRSILHPKDDYNMNSQVGRKFIWKRGIGYMFTHPVLGVGAAAFEQAEGTLSEISRQYAQENRGLKWSTAHNSFVLVGAELGIGGLVLFVTMIGTSFDHLSRIKAGPRGDPLVTPEDAAFAQMLIASLIAFCVAGFFVSGAYFSFLYALIGLVIAEDSLRRRRLARGAGQPIAQAAIPTGSARRGRNEITRTHWAPTG